MLLLIALKQQQSLQHTSRSKPLVQPMMQLFLSHMQIHIEIHTLVSELVLMSEILSLQKQDKQQ